MDQGGFALKKLLQKPGFVIALAIAAIGVVVWSSTAGMRQRRAVVVNPAAAAAVARQAAISAQNAADAAKAETVRKAAITAAGEPSSEAGIPATSLVQFGLIPPFQKIDDSLVRARLTKWLESPARDPFAPPPLLAQSSTNMSVLALKLKSVWRQTDGSFAVINSTVVQVGDTYEGFRILYIDTNAVVVNSELGQHRLELPSLLQMKPVTNLPPSQAASPTRPGPPQTPEKNSP